VEDIFAAGTDTMKNRLETEKKVSIYYNESENKTVHTSTLIV